MAFSPKKSAQPKPKMDDTTDDQTGADAGGADGEDEGEGGDDDQGEGPTVIATIVDNGDGSFTLYRGDEPEEDEEGGSDESEGGSEGEEGDDNAGEGSEDESEDEDQGEGEEGGEDEQEPEGEHFDAPGPLLKAVLDILNEAESKNGGGETGFSAGFNESKEPTPKR